MHDSCVCCGEIIPEGRQVCNACEMKRNNKKIELNDYVAEQSSDNYIRVFKDGLIIYCASCTRQCSEDELRGLILWVVGGGKI